jgi:hypothetical protein
MKVDSAVDRRASPEDAYVDDRRLRLFGRDFDKRRSRGLGGAATAFSPLFTAPVMAVSSPIFIPA